MYRYNTHQEARVQYKRFYKYVMGDLAKFRLVPKTSLCEYSDSVPLQLFPSLPSHPYPSADSSYDRTTPPVEYDLITLSIETGHIPPFPATGVVAG